MIMKTCSGCKKEKPINDFSFKNKAKNIRHYHCSNCRRLIKRTHYLAHKKRIIQESRARTKLIRERFKQFKSTLECSICDEDDSISLDFHHENPSEKESTVSEMVGTGCSWDKIQSEIDKCLVVCRNCHMKVHEYGLEETIQKINERKMRG
jgi:hypothetical protein